MSRTLTFALVVSLIALGAGRLKADEVRGKIKSVDADKHTVTLTVGDIDRTLHVANDAKVSGLYGKKLKKAVAQEIPGGLQGVKEGAIVSLTTEKDEVKQIKLEDLQPKAKKKNKGKKASKAA
jgi:hypothetical protein